MNVIARLEFELTMLQPNNYNTGTPAHWRNMHFTNMSMYANSFNFPLLLSSVLYQLYGFHPISFSKYDLPYQMDMVLGLSKMMAYFFLNLFFYTFYGML